MDKAIREYTEALQHKDMARIELYRSTFESRIDELEDFYLDHEDDERSILFEKQRLRLRRALTLAHEALSSRQSAHQFSRKRGDTDNSHSLRELTTSMLDNADVADMKMPSTGANPSRTPNSPKTKGAPKLLYSWEVHPGAASLPRDRKTIEMGNAVFEATDTPGVYAAATDVTSTCAYIDVDFILTEVEYEQLIVIRRAQNYQKVKRQWQHHRVQTSPYINSALPYVDASRIEAAIFHPPRKDSRNRPVWHY